mgnify:CR=1 FL=1
MAEKKPTEEELKKLYQEAVEKRMEVLKKLKEVEELFAKIPPEFIEKQKAELESKIAELRRKREELYNKHIKPIDEEIELLEGELERITGVPRVRARIRVAKVTVGVPRASAKEEQIYEFLKANRGQWFSAREITSAIGGSYSYIRNLCMKLANEGKVESGTRGRAIVFRVP